MSERKGCSAPDCPRPHSSKGYCAMHAERVRRNGTVEGIGRSRRATEDRLWAKVDRRGDGECWPWLGAVTTQGYGRIRTGPQGSRSVGAHRAAWVAANPGEVEPPVLDHTCHDPAACVSGPACEHRRCCNPAHLEPSTTVANGAPDRQWTRAQLTHCTNGHEFTPENTAISASDQDRRPRRKCRACDRDRYHARKAAA